MKVNNTLAEAQKKPKFTVAIQTEGYKNLINRTLGDPKRAAGFITAITSAVSANPELQNCDAGTILSAGLLGEALNLSPSPQLGQYYLVPYNDSKRGKLAQFQLGYKGYIQLAARSGQYRRLNVLAVKQGELVKFNPLDEEIEVNLIEDEIQRENTETIGYYAFFEYLNGFRKAIYWSKSKMQAHAQRYSKSYNSKYSYWNKDFDVMACKTMLRQLISKWGVMSVELQKAVESDMGVISENGAVEYVDIPEIPAADEPFEPLSGNDILFGGAQNVQ